MTIPVKCKGRMYRLPHNNQMFMLLFTRCNVDHTAPCNDQRLKYAKVEYGKYAKDGVYIAKGMYVTPHMVTNSFQERAVPIWDDFVFPNGDPHMVMGIPVW
jgi:hypothetical protein